jgi:SAM-dependent methyltransferase
MLPFQAESFDFITCQFAFHHLPNKAGMLGAVFKVLRQHGRLVIRNLCPQEHRDWLYYKYFPEALAIDLADFWPPETIEASMAAIGFRAVTVEREHLRFEQDLRAWRNTVLRRDANSQLLAISDAAYETGMRRLERELEAAKGPVIRADHLCFVTIRGDKRSGRIRGR